MTAEVRDHPRRCGENAAFILWTSSPPGSPPQVRGKHRSKRCKHLYLGITPAGAGKTYAYSNRSSEDRDHPRRCGENIVGYVFSKYRQGSPPQVRGKPSHNLWSQHLKGITPAGAGKTHCVPWRTAALPDHPRRCGENLSTTAPNASATGSPPQVRGKH